MPIPARADFDPWMLFLGLLTFCVAVWSAYRRDTIAGDQQLGGWINLKGDMRIGGYLPRNIIELSIITALAFGVTAAVFGEVRTLLVPLGAFLLALSLRQTMGWRLTLPGMAWLSVEALAVAVSWWWLCLLINEIDLPFWNEAALYLAATIAMGIGYLGWIERIAREASLTHQHWRLPNRAPQPGEQPLRSHRRVAAHEEPFEPRVSVHLPCYAEPPQVVKQTMDCLAAQDYQNFEVIVIDNNTKDEALWRPLEAHAELLNRRLGREVFRFFHVAPLPGAKAGALNWVLDGRMDPTAEIVSVIDADYLATPDFLSRLVPFFRDKRVGYLQTPHDYREYEGNAYLTGCHWEYMPNNKVDMCGVSEYGGAFTIGTMCLLRAEGLRRVGGWAEWCLTEDSEVSVRLRAAGYRGMYLGETFGRGLIPDGFDDYKKQRFRWTAGPVQQLRRHWKLFLPEPYARPMPGWTKLLEVLRCSAPLHTLSGLVLGLIGVTAIAVAVLLGAMDPIQLAPITWPMIGLGLATGLVRNWHRYRLTGCHRIPDMIRGEIARASLTYIVLISGVAGLSNKPHAWRRTPKFGESGGFVSALSCTIPEMVLGAITFAIAAFMLWSTPVLGTGFALLVGSVYGFLSLRFFAAPYMALLALAKPVPQGEAPAEEGKLIEG
ncbi:glycosyltransferase [Croceicoccus mobilis]|uniref:Beta-monoglucosyldiacylglycerol synthase n=1 Tax=Croceicoccus mobilis TaxID=1703339 RepID=A0A916Z040_9SPHN|nr:glycosyltransferase [Croceicoccus mobilis]GGD69503.1 hypothetical protein GCM10010990_18770 [Croceicoccus mobilis]